MQGIDRNVPKTSAKILIAGQSLGTLALCLVASLPCCLVASLPYCLAAFRYMVYCTSTGAMASMPNNSYTSASSTWIVASPSMSSTRARMVPKKSVVPSRITVD
jgi:hypothetical protein